MTGDDAPELGEIMEFPDDQADGDRRWIVLYDEDYDNVALDVEGNVGVLVDIEQVGEILRLASMSLADLSHRDADHDQPLRDLRDAIDDVIEDGEDQ